MSRFFESLGRFSVRFRYAIVVFWVAAVVASLAFLPSLSSVVQNNYADFLPKGAPSLKAANLASPFQKSTDSIIVTVVYRPSGALSSGDQSYVTSLAGSLAKVPDIVHANVAAVSASGKAEQIEVLSSVSSFDTAGLESTVSHINSDLAAHAPPSGVKVRLAGAAATAVAQATSGGSSASSAQLYSVIFILVLLMLVFRSILAPFLTLIPALMVTLMAEPVVARLTSVLHFQVSSTTQLLMIVLVLGAGTDYGLFLVFRTREELRNGTEKHEAVRRALSRVGESITFSAFTVIAAVLSLITATFGFYRGLGWPLAIAVFLMLLAGLTLQPALLAIFGRAAFFPTRKNAGAARSWWGTVAARLVSRPAITLSLGLVVLVVLAAFATGNKASGFASADSAPAHSSVAAGNTALATYFPKSTYNPTELVFRFKHPIWDDLSSLVSMQHAVQGSSLFVQVDGALDPAGGAALTPTELADLHTRLGPAANLGATDTNAAIPQGAYEVYRATENYISAAGTTVLFDVTLRAGNPGLTPAIDAIPTIRTFTTNLAHKVGATASGVAGEAPASHDVSAASNHDLIHIIPLVILIIAILLGIVLRSVVAPIFLVISVAVSYFAALGIDVILFMHVGSQTGLTFVLPFLLFIFLLALGEDYNILVMTRIREECHHRPLKEAIVEAIGKTGGTVTAAGMVLAGTFAVLTVASGGSVEVQEIGIGLAVGVIFDTFLVRTLLVPSAAVLLGRWTWWPSKLSLDDPINETPQDQQIPVGTH